jgi:hypothetical protein
MDGLIFFGLVNNLELVLGCFCNYCGLILLPLRNSFHYPEKKYDAFVLCLAKKGE